MICTCQCYQQIERVTINLIINLRSITKHITIIAVPRRSNHVQQIINTVNVQGVFISYFHLIKTH